MIVDQIRWSSKTGWDKTPAFSDAADLVLIFSDNVFFQSELCFTQLRDTFPQAQILGCSSAGNVMGVEISDGDMVATVVKLEHSSIRLAAVDAELGVEASKLGVQLTTELNSPDLRHIFILTNGLQINGSNFAEGLNQAGFPVTGGMAGDGTRFDNTWIMANKPAKSRCAVALGFYGSVTVGSGCYAGWEEFGANRIITKSDGNVLYELDGEPALALYKRYLGKLAKDLPASGLRFPLSIHEDKSDKGLIRTLLAVDEAKQSLTFAGDVPQGYVCSLMRTDMENLIENAGMAAEAALPENHNKSGLCLVVSCVGRRMLMGQRNWRS